MFKTKMDKKDVLAPVPQIVKNIHDWLYKNYTIRHDESETREGSDLITIRNKCPYKSNHKDGGYHFSFELFQKDALNKYHDFKCYTTEDDQKIEMGIGLLCGNICVLDFDNKEIFNLWKQDFPELVVLPHESTRRGIHVFFTRPKEFDRDEIWTCIGIDKEVDLLTYYKCGTRALCNIAPSPGKNTIVPFPYDGDKIQTLSTELIKKVTELFRVRKGSNGKVRYVKEVDEYEIKEIDYEFVERLLFGDEIEEIYYTNFELWKNIGWALSNFFKGAEKGLEIYKEFSQRWDLYNGECEKHCEKIYNEAKHGSSCFGINYIIKAVKSSVECNERLFNDILDIISIWEKESDYCKKIRALETSLIAKKDIDDRDDYLWVDFEDRIVRRVYDTKEELKHAFKENINRVLQYITLGEGIYLKKDMFGKEYSVCKTPAINRIKFSYCITTEKGKKKVEKVSLEDLYKECRSAIYGSYDYILNPNEDTGKVYNLFRGFKASKRDNIVIDELKIARFLNKLEDIYCNSDEELFHFFFSWIRHIIKYPWIKSKVFVFLLSEFGYGKSTLAEFLKKYVFGSRYCDKGTLAQITAGFNSILEGKVFMLIEELQQGKNEYIKNFDYMKDLITSDTLSIERKFREIYSIRNYINFLGCSNNKFCLNIQPKDERYFCLELVNKKDSAFWDDFYREYMNDDFGEMFYNWVIETPDDPYVDFTRGRVKIPMTKLKEDIINHSGNSLSVFLYHIKSGEIELDDFNFHKSNVYRAAYNKMRFYDSYSTWCMDNGEKKLSIRALSVLNNVRIGKGGDTCVVLDDYISYDPFKRILPPINNMRGEEDIDDEERKDDM